MVIARPSATKVVARLTVRPKVGLGAARAAPESGLSSAS